jgi:glycosyltransferase involved in cell wall biosynthesis
VPGEPQKQYAIKLGFKKSKIFTGLYPAHSEFYSCLGRKKLGNKGKYPKNMISIARYIPQKDLPTLWKAFIKANETTGKAWTLNCFGFGELFDSRVENPHINHLGFKQPYEMEKYILEAGVYVLPSTYEPWGVAVHEMALSALPMVLSDKVGAASMFLSEKNGFLFPSGDADQLTGILVQLMKMNDDELWKMAEESYSAGLTLTSEDWSLTLKTIIDS